MCNSFEEKVAFWKSMERSTPSQKLLAEDYYDAELMPFIVSTFKEKNHDLQDLQDIKVSHMILSVGTSYQPLVLSLSFFNPEKVLFLHTEESEKEIDKILKFIKLESSSYKKSLVEKSNTLKIYNEIKKAYLDWGRPEGIVIDFTGGTKAMSSAAAMAGAFIKAKLVYVGNSKYLNDLRRPEPLSEFLEEIPNPYRTFGDLEFERALNLFDEFDYAGAHEILEKIATITPNPEERPFFEVLSSLALCYRYWDSLNFEAAYNKIVEVCLNIKKYSAFDKKFVLRDKFKILHSQYLALKKLSSIMKKLEAKEIAFEILDEIENFLPVMFTMYSNAIRRREQKKYDMAALLMYRLLEMIMQRRMIGNGIYVSSANYAEIIKYKGTYFTDVNMLKSRIFRTDFRDDNLPNKISLMEGYIQLSVLDDDILDNQSNKDAYLKRIRSEVDARNRSIFAHGYKTITKEEYDKFEKLVIDLFVHFCEIEEINFEEQCLIHTFINPKDSKFIKR